MKNNKNLNEEEQSRKEIFKDLGKEIYTNFINFIKSRNAKSLYLKQLKQLNYEKELEQGKEVAYQNGDLWAFCKPFVFKYGFLLTSLLIYKIFLT